MVVTCTYPWSSRDLFDIYNDCHIYQPIYLFMNSIIFIESVICFFFGLHQSIVKKRKDLAISAIFLGLCFSISYGIIIMGKISFGDKNIGLNTVHSFGLSFIYLNINFQGERHLEVIKSVDARTVARAQTLLKWLIRFNIITFIICTIGEFIGMVVPAIITDMDPIKLLGPIQVVVTFLATIPHLAYGWKLKEIICDVQKELGSKEKQFYEPIRQTLSARFTSTLISLIFGEGLTLCWMLVPAIRRNLYIVYNIQMLLAPVTGIASLWDARHSTKSQNASKEGTRTTTKENEKGIKDQELSHTFTQPEEHRSPSRSEEGLPLVELDGTNKENGVISSKHKFFKPESEERGGGGGGGEILDDSVRSMRQESEDGSIEYKTIWNPLTVADQAARGTTPTPTPIVDENVVVEKMDHPS